MNHEKAYEDVQIIKEMLMKTRRNVAGSGKYFILWGYVILAAILSMYGLLYLNKPQYIWIGWVASMAVGSIVTVLFSRGEIKGKRTCTFLDKVIAYVSMGFFISFFLASFAFPFLDVYSYTAISSVTAMIAGTFTFIIAMIYRWKVVLWAAIIWWVFSIGAAFIPPYWRPLSMAFPLIFGYLLPGYVIHFRERKALKNE